MIETILDCFLGGLPAASDDITKYTSNKGYCNWAIEIGSDSTEYI